MRGLRRPRPTRPFFAIPFLVLLICFASASAVLAQATLTYPIVETLGTWTAEVVFLNGDYSSSVSGTFTAYDRFGATVGSPYAVTIPTKGVETIDPHTRFGSSATAVVFTAGGSTPQASLAGYLRLTNGNQRAAIPAVTPLTGTGIVSHVASDGSWDTWLVLFNTTDAAIDCTITFNTGEWFALNVPAKGQEFLSVTTLLGGPRPDIATARITGAAGLAAYEIFGQGEQLSAVPITDLSSTSLTYPHVETNAPWWTGFVTNNPADPAEEGSPTASCSVTSYGADGAPIGEPFTFSLAPGQKKVGFATDYGLPEGTKWCTVSSDAPIQGFELFGTNDQVWLAGYSTLNLQSRAGAMPLTTVGSATGGRAGLALVNDGSASRGVLLTALNQHGETVDRTSRTVAVNEKLVLYAHDLFERDIADAEYVTYTTSGPLTAFSLREGPTTAHLDGLPALPLAWTVAPPPPGNGHVTFSIMGSVQSIEATTGASPTNISALLDAYTTTAADPQEDNYINLTPNGRWMVLETTRFHPECASWSCLALVDREVNNILTPETASGVIHPDGLSAVGKDGARIIYSSDGGTHPRDLYLTDRTDAGSTWTDPLELTAGSSYAFNYRPAISADGETIVFNCGQVPYIQADICQVNADGSGFTVLVSKTTMASGATTAAEDLSSPDFAPDGSVVFEGDWDGGEHLYRVTAPGATPTPVSTAYNNDLGPCVLPDGRIVSLWPDREGGDGVHEIKIMNADGSEGGMLFTGTEVFNVGLGCGN